MFRPRLSGALAAGALLCGAALSTPTTVQLQASAAERVTGKVQFLLLSTSATEEGGPIAATGVIHAKGTDHTLKGSKDRFAFPAGDLMIKHKVKGTPAESFDAATCLFSFVEKGTWKAIDGSTGAYVNAKGGGTYKAVGYGFSCDPNKAPDPFSVTIKAKGDLSY
jgi:hypothetical protein